MIAVYPAGAIQGENLLESLNNINKGIEWTSRLRRLGYSPFPVFEDFMDIMRVEGIEIESIYQMSLEWLKRADCMFVTPGWERSRGTKQEIAFAREHNVPVFYDIEMLTKEMPSR